MNLNKVLVIGYLTHEPELRYGANATPVCSFTVATNFYWHDATGERQQETEFHRCVAFGDLAERIAEFMTRGSHICVEGRLKTESWEHGDHKHYRTKIVAERATFGSKRDREATGSEAAGEERHSPAVAQTTGDDDIPF